MPCDYSVVNAAVTQLTGTTPSWLQGTYYHAIMFTKVVDKLGLPGPKTLGAVCRVHFPGSESEPPML